MNVQAEIVDCPATVLAVVEVETAPAEIPARIPGMLEQVHARLNAAGLQPSGCLHIIYDRFTAAGMRMQLGFPVAARPDAAAAVQIFELPACRAAHTVHRGDYSGLYNTHTALNAWCERQSLALCGVSWEIYGEWDRDPANLVTDVYLGLI